MATDVPQIIFLKSRINQLAFYVRLEYRPVTYRQRSCCCASSRSDNVGVYYIGRQRGLPRLHKRVKCGIKAFKHFSTFLSFFKDHIPLLVTIVNI